MSDSNVTDNEKEEFFKRVMELGTPLLEFPNHSAYRKSKIYIATECPPCQSHSGKARAPKFKTSKAVFTAK